MTSAPMVANSFSFHWRQLGTFSQVVAIMIQVVYSGEETQTTINTDQRQP